MTGIAVGVDNFYYAKVTQDDESGFETEEIKRVRFLNNISVTPAQDTAKAFGDNQTAAVAVSNGDLEVSTTFVSVPVEDQAIISGAEYDEGVVKFHKDDVPPDVALVFERTNHDGSSEWLGLYKGKFTRAPENGQTKEDSYTFQNKEMTGTFMPRLFDGYTHMKATDAKGSTAGRDKVFLETFGSAFPEPGAEG